jgi:flagellar motility protein MotE (MotC chaperone)
MAVSRKLPAISGVGLIVLCFFGSAGLRLSESGRAMAEGLGAMARNKEAAVPDEVAPSADADLLLAAIREREAQLEREAAALADRAQTLDVAETKLAEQLAAFEKAQADLEATLAMADRAAEKDIERMTTVYENMKPDDAARIFDRMAVEFAAGLLARMRPEAAAQVLTAMDADGAYAVTLTIASRNARVPTE